MSVLPTEAKPTRSRSDGPAEPMDTVGALICLGRRLQRGLAQAAGHLDLDDGQLLLLWQLSSRSETGMHQTGLAASLGVSPAQISTMVERLRRSGLISGHRPPHDRRRQFWRLTPAGSDLLTRCCQQLRPWLCEQTQAADVRADSPMLRIVAVEDDLP